MLSTTTEPSYPFAAPCIVCTGRHCERVCHYQHTQLLATYIHSSFFHPSARVKNENITTTSTLRSRIRRTGSNAHIHAFALDRCPPACAAHRSNTYKRTHTHTHMHLHIGKPKPGQLFAATAERQFGRIIFRGWWSTAIECARQFGFIWARSRTSSSNRIAVFGSGPGKRKKRLHISNASNDVASGQT